jgi:hypothetical protein
MQLSREWSKSLLSWTTAITLCVISVTLCVVSGGLFHFIASAGQDDTAAAKRRMLSFAVQSDIVRTAASADPPTDAILQAGDTQPTPPSTLLSHEAVLPRRDDANLSVAPPVGRVGTERDSTQTASGQEKRLNLRIARDSERCPKVVCYKWHLVTQRLKPPHYTKVELAGLRLAPGLQHKVENGNIDLLIDAVAHHRTINGHDTLIFVATNLAGVTPHDASP